ncbi:hypothetical protein C7B61_00335 [filamentous cyanobacterium CCP1]|nr:hypothetical protein C7B76_16725 [filamentous cyanobacterium CCP2]PSB68544.1 hypothetical protein C7B61_00335 [filamentous cyanobacterium CCP1]
MSIAELNELDLIALEQEFGQCLPEEIAQCSDIQALLDLARLINRRLEELLGGTEPVLPIQVTGGVVNINSISF